MGTWTTSFELSIGPDPAVLSRLRAATSPRWLSFLPGLHLQIKDDRVRAVSNELLTTQPTRPVLRGHVVTDHAGTRIVGTLSWGLLKSYALLMVLFATLAAFGTITSFRDQDRTGAITCIGVAVACIAGAIWFRHDEDQRRAEDEARLREELHAVLHQR